MIGKTIFLTVELLERLERLEQTTAFGSKVPMVPVVSLGEKAHGSKSD
jgi:hypothetical protein